MICMSDERFDNVSYWKRKYDEDEQKLKEVKYEMLNLKERYHFLKERRDKSREEYLKLCSNPLPPFDSK